MWVVYGPMVMAAGGVKRVGLTGEYKNLEGAAIVANKSRGMLLSLNSNDLKSTRSMEHQPL